MTTDCLDCPTFEIRSSDRHLRDAIIAAAVSILFVIPGTLAVLSLL